MKIDFSNTERAFVLKSTAELVKAKVLFQMIQARTLVHYGAMALNLALRLRLPIQGLIKLTIFDQFCGGTSLESCRPMINARASHGVRSILDYGVEGEKSELGFQSATEEILRTAEEARTNENIPFIVFKFTGIARFELLEKISKHSPLSPEESAELQRVEQRFGFLIQASKKAKKPLMVDAEETWIQDAIDQMVIQAMAKENIAFPQIYTTLQMYRKDSLTRLESWLESARNQSFKIGIKLVRGAYMDKERLRAIEVSRPSPIHDTKLNTDQAFDQAVSKCLTETQTISILIGTHNESSCLMAARHLLTQTTHQNVWFSQLLGMSDHISFNLGKLGLNVAKYVPYGPIASVVPYLIRRAEENTAVANESSRELVLIEQELKRRRQGKGESK